MAKLSFLLAAGATLLLTPLTASQAQSPRAGSRLQTFSGGGAGRAAAVNSAPAARTFSGAQFNGNRDRFNGNGRFYQPGRGYYGGTRYFYRGGYYLYDPFFYGGFGYPSYYYGSGFGLGFSGPVGGYYGGYPYGYGGPVYNGRVIQEGGREDREQDGGEGGRYSPGSMARVVQRELKERGYYKGKVDGQFGESSSRALRSFQRDKDLRVTGRLDERTLGALGFEKR